MAFSNKLGPLLLTTGNKSELAVGYCTLYGDMAGGLAPISDLPKMRVYALAGTSTGARDARSSRPRRSRRPRRPSCAPDRPTRIRSLPTSFSTGSSKVSWSGTRPPPRSPAKWERPRRSPPGSRGRSTGPSTSGSRPLPGCECRRRRSGAVAAYRSRRCRRREVRGRPAAIAVPVEGDPRLVPRRPPLPDHRARRRTVRARRGLRRRTSRAQDPRPLPLPRRNRARLRSRQGRGGLLRRSSRRGRRRGPLRAVEGTLRRRRRGRHPRAPSRAGPRAHPPPAAPEARGPPPRLPSERRERHRPARAPLRPVSAVGPRHPGPDPPAVLHAEDRAGAPSAERIPAS